MSTDHPSGSEDTGLANTAEDPNDDKPHVHGQDPKSSWFNYRCHKSEHHGCFDGGKYLTHVALLLDAVES